MKVLVIDDDHWTRRVTVEALAYSGIITVEAESGSEGVDLAIRERPDCVLVDFFLPDCEGTKVMESIRSQESDSIPVIFVTTLLDESQRARLIEIGASAVLAKPLDLVALPGILRHIVG